MDTGENRNAKRQTTVTVLFYVLTAIFPVDIRRRFNVDTMSSNIVRGRINVETTSFVYRVIVIRKRNGVSNWLS